MELAVRKLATICLFIFGVSHVAQPRLWVQFFMDMHDKGEVGSFYNALLNLPLGVLIASFHNVWRGLPVLLTLLGWALVLKGFIYFMFPNYGVGMLGRVSMERSWEFIVVGALLVGISCILTWSLFRSPKVRDGEKPA